MAKLHRGGRTRAWIGRLLGGDATLGDRVWRRALHLAGALVLLVYVLPSNTFGPVPVRIVLVLALAGVLLLEVLRRWAGWELPTIRPHEHSRIASFALYAVGLVVAVLVFPEPVAVAAVLGAAIVDPVLGELRLIGWTRRRVAPAGLLLYGAIAGIALVLLRAATWPLAVGLAGVGAIIAVAVEGPEAVTPIDDDLAMTVLPGAALTAILLLVHAVGLGGG